MYLPAVQVPYFNRNETIFIAVIRLLSFSLVFDASAFFGCDRTTLISERVSDSKIFVCNLLFVGCNLF